MKKLGLPVVGLLAIGVGCNGSGPSASAPAAPVVSESAPHGHTHHGQGMHHRFDGAEGWAKVFDAKDRDEWQKPEVVLAALELEPKSLVADVGAGTGYFSVRIAPKVPEGKVFAIDVEADMVRYLDERAKREGLARMVAVKAEADDPKIPEPVDVVLIVDTLHHISHRAAYFGKLREKLRPGGRVVVVDFAKNATMGPPPEHRLSVEDVLADASGAGLVKSKEVALPQQYVLVLTAR